jgi:signal transduction histidine kinase
LNKPGRSEVSALAGDVSSLETFLARSSTVGTATVGRDGAIIDVNEAFARLVGPVGSIYDAIAEGQAGLVSELLVLAAGEWCASRASLVASDGNLVDCEISAIASGEHVLLVAELLHEPADRLNRHLLELNDELIAARRALADGNRKLRELDDLKNMFIASASHDLKTPLTSIIGWAEMLEDEALDDDARPMVVTIGRSAMRMLAMIDDLLGAAQVMAGELRLERAPADFAGLLRHAVEAIEPVATAGGVTVELDGPASLVAFVDERRVLQILDNLLSNAVKYSPDGGSVDVACVRSGSEISVTVSDGGIGIPPEDQAQLFGRFFRASSARARGIEGTGLGLANARAFAEAHGGRLDCASELGVGSTFTLVLPAGADQE